MSSGNTGYHSADTTVPNRDIVSALDNPTMASTANQIHVDQLTATICQLVETNKILGDKLKQLAETNVSLAR